MQYPYYKMFCGNIVVETRDGFIMSGMNEIQNLILGIKEAKSVRSTALISIAISSALTYQYIKMYYAQDEIIFLYLLGQRNGFGHRLLSTRLDCTLHCDGWTFVLRLGS